MIQNPRLSPRNVELTTKPHLFLSMRSSILQLKLTLKVSYNLFLFIGLVSEPVDQRTVRFDDLTVQYDFNQDPEEMFDRSLTGNQYTSPVRSFRANNLFDSNSQTQFPSKDSSIIFLDDDFYG